MKKWMLLVVAVVLVAIVALVPAVFAQEPMDGYGPGSAPMFNGPFGQGPQFVDEDGDGVCDNFVDEDGDGICDHDGTGQGQGSGFVDEDGDGVCDHAGNGEHAGRRGGSMGRWTQ